MPPKFPTKLVRKLNRARVDFRENELRRFVLQHGLAMKWESAARCPCVRQLSHVGVIAETWEPRTDCVECKGTGVLYYNSQKVTGFALGPSQEPKLRNIYGEEADGMIRLTLLPEHRPGVMDRFTLLDSTFAWDEIKTRETAGPSELDYPIVIRDIVTARSDDPTCSTTLEVGIVYMRRATSAGVLVPGELVEGTDFEVDANGDIDWALGDALGTTPAIGERYSVRYFAHPVYVVSGFPFTHRDQFIQGKGDLNFTPLMTRADAKLEHSGSRGLPLET